MKSNSKKLLLLLCAVVIYSKPVNAHTGFNSHAGILSNIIAVAIVFISIIIYLLISNRKR